jgi:urease accessory protein
MATDAALLQLIWLASPALPVGAFSYSEGLESAVDAGLVHDEASTRAWLLDQLHLVQARADLAAAGAAFAAWRAHDLARAEAVNAWVQTTRETAEQRLQAEQAGRSMAEWLRQRDADADPPDARVAALRGFAPAPTWPVAVALAAARSEAEARDALLAIAFGWAENMVQAAVKAVPLGQSAGQRVLAALAEAIPPRCRRHPMSLDDESARPSRRRWRSWCARHETQYSRLFRS